MDHLSSICRFSLSLSLSLSLSPLVSLVVNFHLIFFPIQAICQQVATRQAKMDTVQTLAAEVLKLPSAQAEKQDIKKQLTELYNDWDDICQQVPYAKH